MTKEELQFDLLKTELGLTQQQMDKYDQLSTTTKTWAITLWTASVGWAFQVKRLDLVLLNIIILAIFWVFDALHKTFRQDYKRRRDEVASALECLFQTGTIPPHITSPRLPVHRWSDTARNLIAIHVALPYLLLIVVSSMLYLGF